MPSTVRYHRPLYGPLLRLLALTGLGLILFFTSQQQGAAMGSVQNKTISDIAMPAGWTGIDAAVARDDSRTLASGQMRIYRAPQTGGAGLPASILDQAGLIRQLAQDLPALPQLSDVSTRGAGIAALTRAAYGTGKYSQPNRILTLDAGSDQPGFALMRIADDAPDAPGVASLYCVRDGAITISHFGGVRPSFLIEIKDRICTDRL
ncbi:hypothetical protein SAMN04488043_11655 [Thalassovita gelatinovora]|uniref:hypothetical protein n=1 Tax=Thalassovita gelatinovora TaxID=53501 RepID=UPI0008CCE224|nr:hypothetical protein [Thalassovita gelatinovora]QIZ82698.1 hypothetical protein HFZ77_19205 [Thalassovita gelatinovora]SER12196.1 hypothetical protein SAMN04488043_11655 [Thalassovita gelatinovora]